MVLYLLLGIFFIFVIVLTAVAMCENYTRSKKKN